MMRLLFIGSGHIAVPFLESLAASSHTVVAVLSQPDRPKGRGNRLTPTPLAASALSLGLPVLRPERLADPEAVREALRLGVDGAVCVAYGQRVPKTLTEGLPFGALNAHPSLLPRHRGASPIPWTILSGDREAGVTIIQMVESMDAGPVWAQAAVGLTGRESAGELEALLIPTGVALLQRALGLVESGQSSPVAQDHAKATLAPKLPPEARVIDWSSDAEEIGRLVRALSPDPGARTHHRGREIRILECGPAEPGRHEGTSGEVLSVDPSGAAIQAGHGVLHVLRVHPANGREMDACSYARGNDLRPGQRLGGTEARS